MAQFELDTKEVGLLLGELEKRGAEEVQKLLSFLPGATIGAVSSLLSDAQSALADISALHQKLSSAPVVAPEPVSEPAAADLAETPTESLPVVPMGPPDASLIAPSEAS